MKPYLRTAGSTLRGTTGRIALAAAAVAAILLLSLTSPAPRSAQAQPGPAHTPVLFRVQAGTALAAPVSGRLLLFLKQGSGDKSVDTDEFQFEDAFVAAREVHNLAPGQSVELNADEAAFPRAFSTLKPADYEIQAVLDVDHTYNYRGREGADWQSDVLPLPAWTPGSSQPVLTLDRHPEQTARQAAATEAARNVSPLVAVQESVPSALLTAFWGHPIAVRAWVILPPGYKAADHYPTAYWTHGFGGSLNYALMTGLALHKRMVDGLMPPMFWVMLGESVPQGTHEFADSLNDGPWGSALTTEFIPALERKYPAMDARPTGRLLNGHSSGGWATLQLQINYPHIFGGTWSTSPDPSDFHNFTNTDLYAPHANLYHQPDGTPTPIMREHGQVLATFEQITHLEDVLGPYGGQVSSFDWVFSPRAATGAPEPMFDHQTGEVHPAIVAYWHDHYDLAHLVEAHWAERASLLTGRLHLVVGTADTFYLDGSAHLFEARLEALHAQPHFTYLPGRTHSDLYRVGTDRSGLSNQIAAEMYAVARPGSGWKPRTSE
ncbi:MAG TPA: alpha/beta hydrolase-fold protein [Acidobacteriaceae bacterium]